GPALDEDVDDLTLVHDVGQIAARTVAEPRDLRRIARNDAARTSGCLVLVAAVGKKEGERREKKRAAHAGHVEHHARVLWVPSHIGLLLVDLQPQKNAFLVSVA